ncbi:protein NDNF [Aethina tumida]|uniref:protein NDNF n=1 Tax=Aethina tumida TaxID=116153 RepID=UPI002147AA51|nr:protein NDNF [Aethina tumida]
MHFSLLFLHIVLLSQLVGSKSRSKDQKLTSPFYDLYPSDKLPGDVQITTFLYKEQPKMFFYWSTVNHGHLSLTVITCSSPVNWMVTYNNTDPSSNSDRQYKGTVQEGMDTQHFTSLEGLYVLKLVSKETDTYVHVYMSTELGGPQALQTSKFMQIKLIKRPKKRVTVKWETSLVDPQGTDYCLVVSSKKNHKSLCNAQVERYGPDFMKQSRLPAAASQTIINWQPDAKTTDNQDPAIVCVNKKTQYTVSNLNQGVTYYFDVFAINHQSNLTYPQGSTSLKFDQRTKPTTLKDAKATFANLKKLDGKAVFKFKVNRKSESSLELFIMPCGGAVNVTVNLQGNPVASKRGIEGFGRLRIPQPKPKARYYIKVYSSNREELRKTSGVEIYATTKSLSKIPLPNIPSEPIVEEYVSLRRCDSVTIGWLSSPGQKSAHYCLVVREGKVREMENYEMPNQCGLESRLRKSADFALKYCKDIKHEKEQVVTERISHLKPNKSYIIQVTVKKPRGKSLSYDLLQVHTLSSCRKHQYVEET